MDGIIKVWNLLSVHMKDVFDVIAYFVLAGSVIVKLTPTLKDDAYFKTIVKFIVKYIALDKYGPSKNE